MPRLEALGILNDVDRAALELYCSAFSRWRKYEAMCREHNAEITLSKDGKWQMVSAYATAPNQALSDVQKILSMFGFTPSAGANMSLATGDGEEPSENEQWWASATRVVA